MHMVSSAPSLLPIIIDNSAPITINAQIAEQIKLLIAIGELQAGDTLPTVTQLAKHLGVNHNTIAAVYNYMIESGYLVAQRGKGTFVARSQAVQKVIAHQQLYNLLGEAFCAASIVGLSPSEFGAAAYAQAVMLNQHHPENLTLVFVEFFQEDVGVSTAIEAEIGAPLSKVWLEDLEASEPKAFKELLGADLVITMVPDQWEVTRFTAPEQEVIAVNIKPGLKLLTEISSKPRNTKMLLVCQQKAGSQKMKWVLESAGISHISFQTLDLESLKQNHHILSQFDVVCASRLVEDYVLQYHPQPEKLMVFDFNLDESNLSVLKARLAVIRLEKSSDARAG
ncbi:GntR family transcriptional regulator [Aetokthonos hydrillicola]|nr:GntR family transcriptional regulator [Aetokthonos hydrillicola]